MKLEDQVLSIGQVLELKKLGFDVKKHSSMCYLPYYYSSLYKIDGYTLDIIEKNDSFHSIPTMSIEDIIKILPKEIEEKVLNIFAFGETWSVGWEDIQYYGSNTLINALFETLKWCIKEKHIEL